MGEGRGGVAAEVLVELLDSVLELPIVFLQLCDLLLRPRQRILIQVLLFLLNREALLDVFVFDKQVLLLVGQVIVLFNSELGDFAALAHGLLHGLDLAHDLLELLALILLPLELPAVGQRCRRVLLLEGHHLLEHLVQDVQGRGGLRG